MKSSAPFILFLSSSLTAVTAFAPVSLSNEMVHRDTLSACFAGETSALFMAGFGGGETSSKRGKNKKRGAKLPKLKAKAQWDRYAELKQCQKVTVGVRMKGDGGDNGDWMEVGRVRSENDEFTEVAVARQRALIAEHAKRLYPVQIPANAVLEWGYLPEENSEWAVVDKSKGDEAPAGIEKKMGFEGISDKATGFYCFYHEGRIVEREEEGKGKRTSVV
mmetsp:Transcript_29912/g.63555  ORF Transcript_29912/g.63555 Transcript_29912/m.63555 type:complete len:219 (+) Transcript_29912:122-778(+)